MAITAGLSLFAAACFIGVSRTTEAVLASHGNSALGLKHYVTFKERMGIPVPSQDEQQLVLTGNQPSILDPKHIRFYIYTKDKPTFPKRLYVNDTEGLKAAGYQSRHKTKIIVHGFLNHLTSNSIQEIKKSFLNITYEDVNVLAVDWSYYALFYGNEYATTYSLGGIIAEFINFLAREGTKLKDIHCIGHSLGAHACGFTGSQVQGGLIGRVTGLDPALPGFDYREITRRINPSQAKFVDCIHTSGGYLGIYQPICSADYYPNRGSRQPGCQWFDYLAHGSCSHGRSYVYFAESILPGHTFPSLSCNSVDFLSENCTDKGAVMGYAASNKFKGIFLTETNESYPYAPELDDAI